VYHSYYDFGALNAVADRIGEPPGSKRLLVEREVDGFPCIVTCEQPTINIVFKAGGSAAEVCDTFRGAIERKGIRTEPWPDPNDQYINPDYVRDNPENCRFIAALPTVGPQAGLGVTVYTLETFRRDLPQPRWLSRFVPRHEGEVVAVLNLSRGPD
jgi:hypothetical protein